MNRQVSNTLFSYPDIYIEQCEKRYGLKFSQKFVDCANSQLTSLFENRVGFKVNKKVLIGWAGASTQEFFLRTKDSITEFSSEIWINNYNFPVTISWKSKSGRVYKTDDSDVDCSDIEFWFEGLDPLAYHKQMYPNIGQPFKIKDLTYELIVERLNIDCSIQLELREGVAVDTPSVFQQIDDFIGDFNERSEKKDREYGVVHNWRFSHEGDRITYDIDLGSAGMGFLKKLLEFFSKLDLFSIVKVE
ncbi:hypothetical protein [Sediminibacterium ginsengisoli]|uniref:Uncharacterized protein n=1 Tax=Sediminibacterium ginsengisoli TaxID=413434 RepID=A0A1T4M2S8_9BACT|nr:hypothetical protein [Sediminibacterium ginsengisoli]SJZ61186.1 hypothetical protein SAMN04488132_103129 [Sediminibacterium ginsengisoli]